MAGCHQHVLTHLVHQSWSLENFVFIPTPTPSLRFGGTCARKGFKQAAFNQESHLLNSMGHCQMISNVHYADQNANNKEIPQNILQKDVNIEHALSIIHTRKVSPALYENATFFDQNKSPIIDPVMSPTTELLKKYSRCEDSQNFVCFEGTCTKSFLYEGDWRTHMNLCNVNAWYCNWCKTGFEYGSYSKVLDHMIKYCKMKPKILQKKLVVMKPDFKCECGNTFGSKKDLHCHKKENCQLVTVNRKKQKTH
jgi:hypothetical protein